MKDEAKLSSIQTGQVDEDSSNCDSADEYNPKEYEEPAWTAYNVDTLAEGIVTKSKEISGFLQLLEPVWISEKKGEFYEGLEKLLEILMGGNRNPEASQIVQKCEELCLVERKMLDYEFWLHANTEGGEALRVLEERCRAVRTSVEYARQGIMYISNSIGTICGNSDYIIQVETFNTNIIAPPRLNEGILREAIAEFNQFVVNSKKKMWNIKAKAVYDLETFIREKLAVNRESFCFLNQEIVSNETERRLTDHEIYWKENGEDKVIIISWTKLLKARGSGYKGYLGVIVKDRRLLKTLLNDLYDKQLFHVQG